MSWGRSARELHPVGDMSHTYLAWSLCRTVSLAGGLFTLGPRRGKRFRYAVRRGVDSRGVATDGCSLFESREDAEACFLRAVPERLPGSFGGTPNDPDSIDVELAR